jgi:hypothetical protein
MPVLAGHDISNRADELQKKCNQLTVVMDVVARKQQQQQQQQLQLQTFSSACSIH